MRQTRRRLLGSMGIALVVPRLARGQQPPRIGIVLHSTPYASVIAGLKLGLKEQGLVEGRDVVFDVLDAAGNVTAIEEGARRLERQRVRLIYAAPMSAASVVKRVTKEVPIFFCVGSDPIAAGLVESFAKPGGRVTGVHYMTNDLIGKRLELLKELLPKLRRIMVLYDPEHGPAQASMQAVRPAAKTLGIEIVERNVRSVEEVRSGVDALKPGAVDALFLIADARVTSQLEHVIRAARAIRLPTIAFDGAMVERGALMSYGVDLRETGRQSAKNVHRLLSGARPGDLPVENITRLAFVLNRRVAQELGVSVPPAMLVRFDRVIE